jgi:hypothetical protein
MRRRSVAQLSEVVAYQSAVGDVSTLAIAALIEFWRSIGDGDPTLIAGLLRDFVPELIDTYQPLSAEVGAGFYEDVRVAANVSAPHSVVLADPPKPDKVQGTLSWAIAPLFRRDTTGARVIDLDAAMSRTVSEVQLEVANGARDTVELNAAEDRGRPRFARHASANACAFCALMATRGSVYRSAESAGNGKKFHAHCHCVAYPVFPDEDDESPPYVLGWEKAYRAARKSARKDGVPPDLNNVLHYMRQSLGAA